MLIVVHPGSACGSTDFNLGLACGAQSRERLPQTLFRWDEKIIVIDGELSHELSSYPTIGIPLLNAESAGRLSRVYACAGNPGWVADAVEFIKGKTMPNGQIKITGAWHDPERHSGCVNAVAQGLKNEGLAADILPCAIQV